MDEQTQISKICFKCKEEKLLIFFTNSSRGKFGKHSWCKSCVNLTEKKKKEADPKYAQKIKDASASSYQRNKEKHRAAAKKRFQELRSDPLYVEKERAYGRLYARANKHKRKEYMREYRKIPKNNFAIRIRGAITLAFQKRGIIKIGKTFGLLGYTPQELNVHLVAYLNNPCLRCESILLQEKNYEMDHIIPISLAMNKEEVLKANQLNNLRLICKQCNREKSNKIEE